MVSADAKKSTTGGSGALSGGSMLSQKILKSGCHTTFVTSFYNLIVI
jgi:hypothetical protein